MFKKITPTKPQHSIHQFPHCDPRILHAYGECQYCDMHPEWQELRLTWGIAFTGYEPEGKELPCPADHARGDKHTLWPGNQSMKSGESLGVVIDSFPVLRCLWMPGSLLACICKPGWGHKVTHK